MNNFLLLYSVQSRNIFVAFHPFNEMRACQIDFKKIKIFLEHLCLWTEQIIHKTHHLFLMQWRRSKQYQDRGKRWSHLKKATRSKWIKWEFGDSNIASQSQIPPSCSRHFPRDQTWTKRMEKELTIPLQLQLAEKRFYQIKEFYQSWDPYWATT